MSEKLTPIALWRTRASPAPGGGSAISSWRSTSGPPLAWMRTALIMAQVMAHYARSIQPRPSERPGVTAGPLVIPNPARGRSELRREPLQAHDLHQLAHFVLLLLAEHH